MNHKSDCALCPILGSTEHVYVDQQTQTRRVEAGRKWDANIKAAYKASKGR